MPWPFSHYSSYALEIPAKNSNTITILPRHAVGYSAILSGHPSSCSINHRLAVVNYILRNLVNLDTRTGLEALGTLYKR